VRLFFNTEVSRLRQAQAERLMGDQAEHHHPVHPELVEGPLHRCLAFDRLRPNGWWGFRPNTTIPLTLSLSKGPMHSRQNGWWMLRPNTTTPFTLSLSKGPLLRCLAFDRLRPNGWWGAQAEHHHSAHPELVEGPRSS
jgi:hypothetical protein